MSLTVNQIQTLVSLIVTTEPDQVSCDECFGQIGEFAEKSLEGKELPEGMQTIQRHLEQCPCCKGEYTALLEALKEIDEGE
jgi:Zn finger protein HypA/HybF involved in hydrogenase expression